MHPHGNGAERHRPVKNRKNGKPSFHGQEAGQDDEQAGRRPGKAGLKGGGRRPSRRGQDCKSPEDDRRAPPAPFRFLGQFEAADEIDAVPSAPQAFQKPPDAHPEVSGAVEQQKQDRGQGAPLNGQTQGRRRREGLQRAPEEGIPQRRIGAHQGIFQLRRFRRPVLELKPGDGPDDRSGHVGMGVEPLQVPGQQGLRLGPPGDSVSSQGRRRISKAQALQPRDIP